MWPVWRLHWVTEVEVNRQLKRIVALFHARPSQCLITNGAVPEEHYYVVQYKKDRLSEVSASDLKRLETYDEQVSILPIVRKQRPKG
jgi:hypothetical protein